MCLLKPLVWNWLVCRSLPEQQLLVNGRMEREARWPLIFKPVRFVREICNLHIQILVASDFRSHSDLQFVMFDFQTFTYICSVRVLLACRPWFSNQYVYVIREICNLRVIKPYQTTSYIFTYMFNIHILQCKAQQGDLWCSTTALFSMLSVLFMHFLRDAIPYQFCSFYIGRDHSDSPEYVLHKCPQIYKSSHKIFILKFGLILWTN